MGEASMQKAVANVLFQSFLHCHLSPPDGIRKLPGAIIFPLSCCFMVVLYRVYQPSVTWFPIGRVYQLVGGTE